MPRITLVQNTKPAIRSTGGASNISYWDSTGLSWDQNIHWDYQYYDKPAIQAVKNS